MVTTKTKFGVVFEMEFSGWLWLKWLYACWQEFTSDLNSRAVKRIDDVSLVRSAQFNEDAGPMAHPIRPDSYIKMDNFYTLTVYEKVSNIVYYDSFAMISILMELSDR